MMLFRLKRYIVEHASYTLILKNNFIKIETKIVYLGFTARMNPKTANLKVANLFSSFRWMMLFRSKRYKVEIASYTKMILKNNYRNRGKNSFTLD